MSELEKMRGGLIIIEIIFDQVVSGGWRKNFDAGRWSLPLGYGVLRCGRWGILQSGNVLLLKQTFGFRSSVLRTTS